MFKYSNQLKYGQYHFSEMLTYRLCTCGYYYYYYSMKETIKSLSEKLLHQSNVCMFKIYSQFSYASNLSINSLYNGNF